MNENTAPRALRAVITIIGRRNAGKSSLINALTGQEVSIVSPRPGTTTDAIAKAYELLPLGPVTFYDTAGLDDEGDLGKLRIGATRKILFKTDLAVITVSEQGLGEKEKEMIAEMQRTDIPFVMAFNKCDLKPISPQDRTYCTEKGLPYVEISAATGQGTDDLKAEMIRLMPAEFKEDPLLAGDLIGAGSTVLLVVPIDLSAPKGRLILPQVQILREILDRNAVAIVTKENELKETLAGLKKAPSLVITDSQVVMKAAADVPPEIKLTTFSALFARYKGNIGTFLRGAEKIDTLKDHDRILIAEACSHHIQCDDIGRIKIPAWLKQYTGLNLEFDFCSGSDFPENLEQYALVVHCGACMLNRTEMIRRIKECERRKIAITNYGIVISKTRGLLERIAEPLTAQIRSSAAL